jgi:hypothetical protein
MSAAGCSDLLDLASPARRQASRDMRDMFGSDVVRTGEKWRG